jgi:hypothetical protein
MIVFDGPPFFLYFPLHFPLTSFDRFLPIHPQRFAFKEAPMIVFRFFNFELQVEIALRPVARFSVSVWYLSFVVVGRVLQL